jgi:hypothetical protein
VDDAFGHWLAGFIDGEGCFIIKANPKRGRVHYACVFEISLRADDAAILHECARRTGLGQVHEKRGRITERRPNPFVRWQMSRRAEALALVELLDRYPLRAKKAQDYAIWKRGVLAHAARDTSAVEAARLDLGRVRQYTEESVDLAPPLPRAALF